MKTSATKLFGIFLGLILTALSFDSIQAQIKPWIVIPNAAQRFQVLSSFNDLAVLDRETGLIWQKTPVSSLGQLNLVDWAFAVNTCYLQAVSNRLGWRLPTVEELQSLHDLGIFGPDDTRLPLGHPFVSVLNGSVHFYWSSTTQADDPTKAYGVSMNANFNGPTTFSKTDNRGVWCVRGGSN